jgi:hypothetical protein
MEQRQHHHGPLRSGTLREDGVAVVIGDDDVRFDLREAEGTFRHSIIMLYVASLRREMPRHRLIVMPLACH